MSTRQERFKLIPAVYLVLRRDDNILLLRRANTGYQDGTYSVIAGHLDGDELAKDGMVREAKEEAGIIIDPKSLRLAHVVHRLTKNQPGQERIDLFFETTEWEGEVTNVEPEKCDDLSWYPIANLPDNMLPLVRNVINSITQDMNYSEYEVEPE